MGKKAIFAFCLICMQLLCFANGTGTMVIRGNACYYDTLVHRSIAPGAKLTQYQFNNISIDGTRYKMKAHVVTIDATNQYNSFGTYLSKDEYFTSVTQLQQIAYEKEKLGLKPVATMNGGYFTQGGDGNGTSKKDWEIIGSLISKGNINFEDYGKSVKYYVTDDKVSHIGITQLQGKVTAGTKSFSIGQVNRCRDLGDTYGTLTLFCNGIGVSRAEDSSTGVDVLIKLVTEKNVTTSKDIQCQVVKVIDGCCNRINDNEAILSGVGDAAEFLKGLSANDNITINLSYVDGNNNPVNNIQSQIFPPKTYAVKAGDVLPFSLENCPNSVIGISKDGKTVYWAENEISSSSNAPCICLADLLKSIGVYDAVWMDGGPSSDISVDGSFITVNNIPGLTTGRYIPDGFILYSTAPDDNTLASLELADPSARELSVGQQTSLKLYGYNQYGEMILSDAQNSDNVEITCTNELGYIKDGVFVAQKKGTGSINIKILSTGKVLSLPVIVHGVTKITAYPDSVFTCSGRNCQIQLTYTNDEGSYFIDPSKAEWIKEGNFILQSCNNGLIVPNDYGYEGNGVDKVYVTYNDVSDTITVTVENLEYPAEKLDLSDRYTSPSYIIYQLPSVPKYFEAEISGSPASEVSLIYSLGSGKVKETSPITINSTGKSLLLVELDYNAADTYPVTLQKLSDSSARLTGLYAYYDQGTGIRTIVNDISGVTSSVYNLSGQRVNKNAKGILIKNGKKFIVK